MHKHFLAMGAAGLAALLVSCRSQAPVTAFPFPAWQPYLEQPIEQIEESRKAAVTQQDMNYTAANAAFLDDARLYIHFHQYLDSLPAAERPAQIEEQRQWLAARDQKRDKACKPYAGGSLASLVGSVEFEDYTEKRIAEIGERMKGGRAADGGVPR